MASRRDETIEPGRDDVRRLRQLAALRRTFDVLSPEYRELMWLEQDLVDRLRHRPIDGSRSR